MAQCEAIPIGQLAKRLRIMGAIRRSKIDTDYITKRQWRRIRGAIAALDQQPELIRIKPFRQTIAKFYKHLLILKQG